MIDTDRAASGFEHIVTAGARMDLIAHDLLFGEGPVWNAEEHALYWVDILGDCIWRWAPGAGRELVMRPSGKANGMTLDARGRRVVAGWGSRSIWRVERDGSIVTLATHFEGRRINSPNDLVVRSDGCIFWTDPTGALFIPGMEGPDVQRYLDSHPVFRLSADGRTVSLVTESLAYPNGLAFSPDERTLYVADTWRAEVVAFPVRADGVVLDRGEVFYRLVGDEPGVADGMKLDTEGNVYVTGPAGVHVVDPGGRLLGRIRLPGHTTNMAWGDDDWHSLYVTTYSSVYRLRLGVAGLPVPAAEGGA